MPRLVAIFVLSIAVIAMVFAFRAKTDGGQVATTTASNAPDAPAAATATAPEPSDTPLPTTQDEPTREDCVAAVDEARNSANALPAEHPSRYIAERHLHQSMVEAGNGEFDDCLYWAERAMLEVRELRHELTPGEKIEVLQPDDTPAKTESAGKTTDEKSAHGRTRR